MTAVVLNTGSAADTTTTAAPEGHDAAMVAKVDAGTQPTTPAAAAATTTPERPAWLPEKFKTPEDFAKSYEELSKKLGTGTTTSETKPAATAPEVPATTDAARQQVEGAGLDFDKINAEFAKEGKLSDATYEALAKGGVPRGVADSYIAGQQALANQIRTEVFTVAGGEDKYTEMVTWAKDSLSPQDIDAYNTAMNSGNTNSMKLAVDGLKARFVSANGTTPNLIGGSTQQAAQASGDVFRSIAEMTTAMKDPRYTTDPAYRKDVSEKLGRSNIM